VDSAVEPALLKDLAGIAGVLSVRYLRESATPIGS
jgi:hypothetical protein